MQIPSWLAGLTGANKFANNPGTGFRANLGDMAQAAGHSMLQHYRGKGGTYGGNPIIEGLNGGPGSATPMPTMTPKRVPENPLLGLGSITGGVLPPALNAAPPPELAHPAPGAFGGGAIDASQPWGRGMPQLPAGIPLPLLLQMGLRGL